MKLFKILAHPYTLIFSFLFILISGEKLGGFYALYILLGLPFGAVHSIMGILGIAVLAITHHLLTTKRAFIQQMANTIGVTLMFFSIFLFFSNDTAHYNWNTFYQGLPLFTLLFTAFVALCFLINTFRQHRFGDGFGIRPLSKV